MKYAQPWLQLHDRSDFPFLQLNFRQRNRISGVFLRFSKDSAFHTQEAAKIRFFPVLSKNDRICADTGFLT
jgi:hypothetical protein